MDELFSSELKAAVSSRSLVPVVGSGVSSATAKMPSWQFLVQSAIEHARTTGSGNPDSAAAALAGGDLVLAAELAIAALGNEISTWLRHCFHVDRARIVSRIVIDRISDLLPTLIATTNYDRLISTLHPEKWEPVTWLDPIGMQNALLHGRRVLHLHGVYDQPQSVVFGHTTYQQLSRSAAYQAVCRSLWLEHTLLFVGCSLNGVEDPDFSQLLAWASETFGPTPNKHYVLLRTGSFSPDEQQRFLQQFRIQLVPFGEKFSDLPQALRVINSNQTKAYQRRIELATELVDAGKAESGDDLANVVEGVKSNAATGLQRAAHTVFQKRVASSHYLRGQLQAFQQILKAMLDLTHLRELNERWQFRTNRFLDASARDSVMAAASALKLVPGGLLAGLKRRGVQIHERVLDGYAQSVLARTQVGDSDAYDVENLNRIVGTLLAIVDADADEAYPRTIAVSIQQRYSGPRLVVTREDRIELRKIDEPSEVISVLPLPKDFSRHSNIVKFEGSPAILTFDKNALLVWQPDEADEPFAEVVIDEPYGINSVTSRVTDVGVLTYLATTSGPVYELVNFEVRRKWEPLHRDFIFGAVVTPEGKLFAIGSGPTTLLKASPGGPASVSMTAHEIHGLFSQLPAFTGFWNGRLEEEQKFVVDNGLSDRDRVLSRYRLHNLNWCEFGFIVLDVQIDGLCHDDSSLLLLDPQSLEPGGYVYAPDRQISSFRFTRTPDGSLFLVVTLLSDFQQSYDLVRWYKGLNTTSGCIFVESGSTLRTHDDLIAMCLQSTSGGFAADDSGGLFHFSVEDQSFGEFHRDEQSRVRSLEVLI